MTRRVAVAVMAVVELAGLCPMSNRVAVVVYPSFRGGLFVVAVKTGLR